MHNLPMASGVRSSAVTLVALETMPCGCVAGVYRSRPSTVEFELVEAKGPHCPWYRHQMGQVISLGLPEIGDISGQEPTV